MLLSRGSRDHSSGLNQFCVLVYTYFNTYLCYPTVVIGVGFTAASHSASLKRSFALYSCRGCNSVVVLLTIVSCSLYHGTYIADNVFCF